MRGPIWLLRLWLWLVGRTASKEYCAQLDLVPQGYIPVKDVVIVGTGAVVAVYYFVPDNDILVFGRDLSHISVSGLLDAWDAVVLRTR